MLCKLCITILAVPAPQGLSTKSNHYHQSVKSITLLHTFLCTIAASKRRGLHLLQLQVCACCIVLHTHAACGTHQGCTRGPMLHRRNAHSIDTRIMVCGMYKQGTAVSGGLNGFGARAGITHNKLQVAYVMCTSTYEVSCHECLVTTS